MSESEIERMAALLEAWFGQLRSDGTSDPEHVQRWWNKDPNFDGWLGETYGDLVAAAIEGQLSQTFGASGPSSREATPSSSTLAHRWLALLLLLDQLPRNIFRGTARMYAGDERARAVCLAGLDQDLHLQLPTQYQVFALMPLMHSEEVELQRRCVAEFESLRARAEPAFLDSLASNISYAREHLDVIEQFGRFPHRNALLGRTSTKAELELLESPKAWF